MLVDGGGVHRQRMAVALHPRAQTAQHVGHDADIRDERDVMDGRFPLAQQRGGDQLERRVLRARHGDVAASVLLPCTMMISSAMEASSAPATTRSGRWFHWVADASEAPFAVPTIIRTGRLRATIITTKAEGPIAAGTETKNAGWRSKTARSPLVPILASFRG